eukprot:1919968-Pleurochrysis_carterae.AAC.1
MIPPTSSASSSRKLFGRIVRVASPWQTSSSTRIRIHSSLELSLAGKPSLIGRLPRPSQCCGNARPSATGRCGFKVTKVVS